VAAGARTGPYAFPTVAIPVGSKVCSSLGPIHDPELLQLTNDGSLVAFNARDYEHERDLWLGDLREGPPGIAYQAPEPSAKKTDIWSPQLANGKLYWIERVHSGSNAQTGIDSWTVRVMNTATRQVTSVSHGDVASEKYVDEIHWNGRFIAASVELPNGSWRVEQWDERGSVTASVAVVGTVYDLAIVGEGVVFTAGVPYPEHDSIGNMRTYYWVPGAQIADQIGTGAFDVAGCDELAAWVADPEASRDSTGYPVSRRLYYAPPSFSTATALSPVPSPSGTIGIDAVACGSESLAWLEHEYGRRNDADALTVWRPGWATPLQVPTEGFLTHVAVNGDWIVWSEYNDDMTAGWLRGVPLNAMPD
jgi:hypothetical protein